MYEFGALMALDRLFDGGFTVAGFDIYVGTSGGAVVAALLASGVRPQEVGGAIVSNARDPLNFRQEDIVQVDWRDLLSSLGRAIRLLPALVRMRFRRGDGFSLARALYALEEVMPPGMYSLERYRAYLRRLLSRPGCTDDFGALARELYIPAVHLDTGDSVLFGAPGWRDVPISDAIVASSALPLFFRPVTLRGLDFVDGGVGQVVHLDRPLDQGSRFAVLINPVIPLRNEEGRVCIPTFSGRCARLREKGVSFVVDQAQRVSYRQRLLLGLDRVRARWPDARVLVIEPPLEDSALFMEHILSYGSRVAMLEYGYRSTIALLRARFDEFHEAFAAAGIVTSSDRLAADPPWAETGAAPAVPPPARS
jgi:predicted acylesterase/phospholipase RssA